MVTINGKTYVVYQLDTVDTFRKRIASNMETLPMYLIFEPELSGKIEEKKYNVRDILKIIQSEDDIDFTSIYNEFGKYFSDPIDLVKAWLVFNNNFNDEKFGNLMRLSASESIKNLGIDFDTDRFFRDERSGYKKMINTKILNNKKEVKELTAVFKSFEGVVGLESTDFVADTISLSAVLNITAVSLLEIFNSLVLTPEVPFASTRDFFKIYRDFKPPISWSISLKDVIFLKINPSSEFEEINLNHNLNITKYQDVIFALEGEEKRVVINFEYSSVNKKGISKASLTNKILDVVSGFPNKKIISERVEKIKGVYYYPHQTINKYIFADLVMNDPLFSIFLGIDESVKATKAKTSIYLYFSDPQHSDLNLSAVVTPKIAIRNDESTKSLDPDLFPIGQPYLRIRMGNSKNTVAVENFKTVFSKLLSIYNDKLEDMLEFYRKYIPDFGEIKENIISGKNRTRLKDIAPEMFLPLYTKKCNNKPEIVDQSYAESMSEDERILFPATPEEGKQYYYVCPYPKHKYPGLFINTLANRNKFPYLPCCYIKSKKNIKGSNFRKYFYGEEESVEKNQQTILMTDKIAASSGFGNLPQPISKLFEILDLQSIYYRKGVSRSHSSFLECVVEALHKKTKFLEVKEHQKLNDKIRYNRTLKWRQKIANWDGLVSGRQELYDLSVSSIKDYIKNPDIYLDPKKFIRILETYFDCNIFLFSRENGGQMELPRFSQAYLRYGLRKSESILIYEHWGGKTENLKYPQCELIVKWDKKNETVYSLNHDDFTVTELNSIVERMREVYNFEKVPPVSLPNIDKLKLESQVIDSYGKTRGLNINFEGTIYTLITTPIPPLKVKEVSSLVITYWNLSLAQEFVKLTQSTILKQNVNKKGLNELYIKYGTVEIILPIKETKEIKLNGIPTINVSSFLSSNGTSNFLKYNYLKKTARYLSEYFIYFFSIYLNDNQITDVTSEILKNFIEEKITVIPNYKYSIVDRTFNLESGIFQGNKLVVSSDETIKRLIYILRLKLQQQFSEVINYRLQESISNYYVDITDFDVHPDQIILQGEDSVEKWIMQPEVMNKLHNEIIPIGHQPYFFKNNLVGDQLYLAQNVNNFKEGIEVGKNWIVQGYNSKIEGEFSEDKENLSFELYSYENKNEIIPYMVSGKQNSYNIKQLGYKTEEKNHFTVLMPVV